MDQVQAALQLSMPVVVGAVAGAMIESRRQLKQLVRAYYWTVPILWLWAIIWLRFDVREITSPIYVEIRGLSLTAVLISGLAVAGTDRSKACWLVWAACLGVSATTGGRMATFTMLLLPILNPTRRGLLGRVTVALAIALAGLALLSTPVFQDRFFGGDNKGLGDIASGNFEDAGRFQVWEIVLEESLQRPWLGHGVGTVQRLIPEIWGARVVQPHNDYLRLAYEVGIIGLIVFLVVFGVQFIVVARYIARTDGVVRQAFAGAWLGMVAFLVVACTDNPIGYMLLFMNPMFALLGAAYAVAQRHPVEFRDEYSIARNGSHTHYEEG
jgi:O-antigen ligase